MESEISIPYYISEHFKEMTGQAYTKMALFLDWIREAKLSEIK